MDPDWYLEIVHHEPDTPPMGIRTWLADPASVKPRTQMPNLELSILEIEALAAFLTQGQ